MKNPCFLGLASLLACAYAAPALAQNTTAPATPPANATLAATAGTSTSLASNATASAAPTPSAPGDKLAPKPLFRDTKYDGAADPSVIYNPTDKKWYMFYTNRRANVPGLNGVAWVHGTPISIATSEDGGATWKYVGEAKINYKDAVADATWWAPGIIVHNGVFHLYVSYVPGTFGDGWNHPRDILDFTSKDLINWDFSSILPLSSHKVIDAGVLRLANGTWRLWYKDEADGSACHYADSTDLITWTEKGRAEGASRPGGEAPNPFHWKGSYWLFRDITSGQHGLALYRSDDAVTWTQTSTLLVPPGTGKDDTAVGHHPEVILSGDRAFMFYFVHPDAAGGSAVDNNARRSSIQVVELKYDDAGKTITADRNAPTMINLLPPKDPETNSKFN